jgi:hypothetical protein
MTANGYIRTTTGFPLLVDPHVSRTRSNGTYYRMPYRPHRYIDLRGSRVRNRTRSYHNDRQKCQFYKFTFHMLVFKLTIGLINGLKVKGPSPVLT